MSVPVENVPRGRSRDIALRRACIPPFTPVLTRISESDRNRARISESPPLSAKSSLVCDAVISSRSLPVGWSRAARALSRHYVLGKGFVVPRMQFGRVELYRKTRGRGKKVKLFSPRNDIPSRKDAGRDEQLISDLSIFSGSLRESCVSACVDFGVLLNELLNAKGVERGSSLALDIFDNVRPRKSKGATSL